MSARRQSSSTASPDARVKSASDLPGLAPDRIWLKALTIRGVYGHTYWARERAIDMVASGRRSLDSYHTHRFSIDQLELAILRLAGEIPGENAMHITVTPQ